MTTADGCIRSGRGMSDHRLSRQTPLPLPAIFAHLLKPATLAPREHTCCAATTGQNKWTGRKASGPVFCYQRALAFLPLKGDAAVCGAAFAGIVVGDGHAFTEAHDPHRG